MDRARLPVPLTIVALAILFYFLSSLWIERMPFASPPPGWMRLWASHNVGVYAWVGLLNSAGAALAAVPVALLLRWLVDRHRVRAAFMVGVLTALGVTGSSVAVYSPFARRAAALMTVELFLVIVLVVPLVTGLLSALISHKPMPETRQL